jgi:hypothetical protein
MAYKKKAQLRDVRAIRTVYLERYRTNCAGCDADHALCVQRNGAWLCVASCAKLELVK